MADTQQDYEAFLAAAKERLNLVPGFGFKDTLYDPQAGLTAYQRRKAAQGVSMEDRIRMLQEAGVKDKDGMMQVAKRMYATPAKAFMLARGGR